MDDRRRSESVHVLEPRRRLDPVSGLIDDEPERLRRRAVPIGLLRVRNVRALLEDDHPPVGDPAKDRLGAGGRDLVVGPTGDQGRLGDAREVCAAIPLTEVADERELVRTVHRQIDLIAFHLVDRQDQRLGPRIQATDVPTVELHRSRLKRWIVVSFRLAQLQDRGADGRGRARTRRSDIRIAHAKWHRRFE